MGVHNYLLCWTCTIFSMMLHLLPVLLYTLHGRSLLHGRLPNQSSSLLPLWYESIIITTTLPLQINNHHSIPLRFKSIIDSLRQSSTHSVSPSDHSFDGHQLPVIIYVVARPLSLRRLADPSEYTQRCCSVLPLQTTILCWVFVILQNLSPTINHIPSISHINAVAFHQYLFYSKLRSVTYNIVNSIGESTPLGSRQNLLYSRLRWGVDNYLL